MCRAVDDAQDEILDFLVRLVQCRTPSQDPEDKHFQTEIYRCHEILEQTLIGMGMTLEKWLAPPMSFEEHPVMVGTLKGAGGGQSIGFNGHVDVVPTGDESAWQHDPWAGEISDGKLWGRGSCDMKGGVTAMIMAVKTIHDLGITLKGDVYMHIVSDEEVVGFGTRECVKQAARPDFVISTEATTLDVMPCSGGLEHLRIEFEGVEEHSGRRYAYLYPQQEGQGHGVSAVDKAIKVVNALYEFERQWAVSKSHPLMPQGFNTLLPGIMIGGPGGGKDGRLTIHSNPGTTPNYCSVEYNVWFYPGENIDDIRKEIESYVMDVAGHDPWLKDHPPKITWGLNNIWFPPLDTDPDHPVVDTLRQSALDLGVDSRLTGFYAAVDLAWYAEQDIPGVIFGPGDIAQAHSPDEFVAVSDIINATKAMAIATLGWCGAE